jgi:hypothetical protein
LAQPSSFCLHPSLRGGFRGRLPSGSPMCDIHASAGCRMGVRTKWGACRRLTLSLVAIAKRNGRRLRRGGVQLARLKILAIRRIYQATIG